MGDDGYNADSKLYLRLTKKSGGMNVYVWEGLSRDEARQPVVEGNRQPVVAERYWVPVSSGFLVVAFPDEDVETELEFEVWVEEPADEQTN